MNPSERHAHHHRLIAERVAVWQGAPRRSGLEKRRRREAYKRAATTLAGHLRSEHGWRRAVGVPLGPEELAEIHDRYHKGRTPAIS